MMFIFTIIAAFCAGWVLGKKDVVKQILRGEFKARGRSYRAYPLCIPSDESDAPDVILEAERK